MWWMILAAKMGVCEFTFAIVVCKLCSIISRIVVYGIDSNWQRTLTLSCQYTQKKRTLTIQTLTVYLYTHINEETKLYVNRDIENEFDGCKLKRKEWGTEREREKDRKREYMCMPKRKPR